LKVGITIDMDSGSMRDSHYDCGDRVVTLLLAAL